MDRVTVRSRTVLATVLALSVLAGLVAYVTGRTFDGRLSLPVVARACTVQGTDDAAGEPRRVALERDQMANAATIAAVGIRRNAPERAIVVALATAYQESGLVNRSDGDRDSVGLFQQRPSQGWGPPEKIRDPRYAANRFYAALSKIKGWERMRVTEAAQAVQRSAYPGAYQKWADEAQVVADALLGNASGAVACLLKEVPAVRGPAAAAALTAGLALDWGSLETLPQAEQPGLAVAAGDDRTGWRYAHWLVSHAGQLGVQRVRFGGLQWAAQAGTWVPVTDPAPAQRLVLAEVFAD
jgi:hypothetical protein